MKRTIGILLVSLAFFLVSCSKVPQVKYVFYMIGDGMGINQVMATEQFNAATGKGPETINFAHFPMRGFVTTVSASSLVTDSAAGGTALASGIKTYNGAIGVDVDTLAVTSLTDWAKAAGYGTGVITSVGINHATPACFMAHTSSRRNYEDIATQFMTAPVDFAAGAAILVGRHPAHSSAYYEQMADSLGITVLKGASAFADVASVDGRVLCLSGKEEEDLPYAIDRKADDTSLSDFVDAGIRYLEAHFGKKGFFCMIEGGKIDYGGHSDDAAACFQELTDFAAAMDVVLAFKERHPDETLIVVTADHETGGLMLGAGRYEIHPEYLAVQQCSASELTARFREAFFPEDLSYKAPSWEEVKAFFTKELGLWDSVPVSHRAEASLRDTYNKMFGKGGNRHLEEANLYSVNSKIVSDAVKCMNAAAGYQWSHGSHSGSPVGLYADGRCAEAFNAVRDNTEIAPLIAELAGYKR